VFASLMSVPASLTAPEYAWRIRPLLICSMTSGTVNNANVEPKVARNRKVYRLCQSDRLEKVQTLN
jgi:hypothetical protein